MADLTTGAKWAIERLELLAALFAGADDGGDEEGIIRTIRATIRALQVECAPPEVILWREDDCSHLSGVIRDVLRAALTRDAVADLLDGRDKGMQKAIAELDERTLGMRRIGGLR